MGKPIYKRINFQLDKDLFDLVSSQAKQLGITKADLIRNFINETTQLSIISRTKTNKDYTTYNLRLDYQTLKKIGLSAKEMGISVSTYMRLIIENKLCKSKPVNQILPVHDLKKLWMQGRMSSITALTETQAIGLDHENLLIYAKSAKKTGEWEKVNFAMDLLNKYRKDPKVELNMQLIKADMLIFQRKISEASNILRNVYSYINQIHDRELHGRTLLLLSKIAFFKENIDDVLEFNERALVYLDIDNHPLEIAEIYLNFAMGNQYYLNFDSVHKYLSRAKNIILGYDNFYLWGKYYREEAAVRYLSNNIPSALESVNKSVKYNEMAGVAGQSFYHYDMVGMLNTPINKNDSYSALSKAQSMESYYRPQSQYSSVKIYKYFIESSSDVETSVNKAERMLNFVDDSLKRNYSKYFISSMKYLNGNNSSMIAQGENGLKEIMHTGNKLISKSAENTLKYKILQPVR